MVCGVINILVTPKFPHVPLGVDIWPLGYEERRVWANLPCNYCPRFPTYLIPIHQHYIGGQTDDVIALCIIVHRAGKISPNDVYFRWRLLCTVRSTYTHKPSATTVMLLAVSFFHITTTLPVTICYSLYYSFPPGEFNLTEVQIDSDSTWQIHLAYYGTKV